MHLRLLIFVLFSIACSEPKDSTSGYCQHDTFIDVNDNWSWEQDCLDVSEKECDRLEDDAQQSNTVEEEHVFYWVDSC